MCFSFKKVLPTHPIMTQSDRSGPATCSSSVRVRASGKYLRRWRGLAVALCVVFAQVLQAKVDLKFSRGDEPVAQRTPARRLPLPGLFHTRPTEAVSTLQDHWGVENGQADGAVKVPRGLQGLLVLGRPFRSLRRGSSTPPLPGAAVYDGCGGKNHITSGPSGAAGQRRGRVLGRVWGEAP